MIDNFYRFYIKSQLYFQYFYSYYIVFKFYFSAVGPRAAKNKEYKNPEYFCYHIDTFGEAEVELAKYRLPAPSNRIPFNKQFL